MTTYMTSQPVLKQLLKEHDIKSEEYNTTVGGHQGLLVKIKGNQDELMTKVLEIIVNNGFGNSVNVRPVNNKYIAIQIRQYLPTP